MASSLNNLKFFIIKIILISYFGYSLAWTAQGVYHNDAHPGKCFISEALILSPGESGQSPNDCCVIYCKDESGSATLNGCISIAPPPNCEWTDYVDSTAHYPLCCLRHYHCPNPVNETQALAFQEHLSAMFSRQIADDLRSGMAVLTQKNEL